MIIEYGQAYTQRAAVKGLLFVALLELVSNTMINGFTAWTVPSAINISANLTSFLVAALWLSAYQPLLRYLAKDGCNVWAPHGSELQQCFPFCERF